MMGETLVVQSPSCVLDPFGSLTPITHSQKLLDTPRSSWGSMGIPCHAGHQDIWCYPKLSHVIVCYHVITCYYMLSSVITCNRLLSYVIVCYHILSGVITCYRMFHMVSYFITCYRMLSYVITLL